MKKIVALAVLSLCLLPACGGNIPPMGFETDLTAKAIKQMPAPLELDEAVEGGPLYIFDADNPDPTLRAYRKLRQARIDEMLKMMDEEGDQLEEVLGEMPAYRAAIITFFGQLAESMNPADPGQATLRVLALDAIQRETIAMIKTTDVYAKLEGLSRAIEETEKKEKGKLANVTTIPMLEYTRWAILGNLVDAISKEFSYSQARAGSAIGFIKGDKDAFDKKVRKLAKKFGKKIGKQVDEVDESFRDALSTHMDLMACFESLKAADYAFTMAMLDFTEKSLPEIAKKAGEIRTNEVVGPEDKDYAVAGVSFLTAFTDEIRSGMKNAEPPPFFRVMGEPKTSGLIPPFMGVAHAGVREMLDNAAGALTSGARKMGSALYGAGEAAVKAPFFVAEMTRQGVSTVASSIISGANTGFGTAMDKAMNRYYGNSRQDERDQIAATRAKAQVAWDRGKQGADTMRTARDYLDNVEKGVGGGVEETFKGALNMGGYVADKLTGGRIKDIWGRDTLSWGAGKIAEMTTGMATGFGKGVINLTLPDATNGELLEGTIDTTFSGIGGSKALVKLSQAFSGAKAVGKEAAEKLTSAAARLELKLESSALKGTSDDIMRAAQSRIMSGSEIAILCDNTRKILANEIREKALKDAEKSIGQILSELTSKTGNKICENIGKAGPSVNEFVFESVEGSAKGVGQAVAGKTTGEFVDNLAGGQADNAIKAGLKFLLVPDKDAAALEKMLAADSRLAKLDPNDPKDREAIEKIQAVLQAKQIEMVEAEAKAEQAVLAKTEQMVKEHLLEEMEKETDKVLSTPVSARGAFSGKYKGSVSMTLTPGGGPVSGSVATEFGTASINGSVGKDGRLSASVSGGMSYDWYGDGKTKTKKSCSLSGSISGTVGNRRVSGTYSTTCSGADSVGGRWTASW
ncbi:MAG: hypothetical protein WC956_07370 [bacterium]